MTIGIHCIENNKNNKRYIGKSVNIESRFSYHKSHLHKILGINMEKMLLHS